jgi:GH24 family phage-related lysozyme (muramidase)
VYEGLLGNEGASGDTTGAADTGELGVTDNARKAVPNSKSMSDKEIARKYLDIQDKELSKLNGYSHAPMVVQEAILDTAYNTSASQMKTWKSFKKHLSNEDYIPALKETLDTANIKKKSSKGLAARRARNFNKVAQIPIDTVEQLENGTIIYRDSTGKTIFKYKAPRHPSSDPGIIKVN